MYPRRILIWVAVVMLSAPLAAMPFTPFERISADENRILARAPGWPSSLDEARQTPRKVDAYLADHFAFRKQLLSAGLRLGRKMGVKARVADPVVTNESGQLVLAEGLLRATGQDVQPDRVATFVKFACRTAARLEAQGARVVLALPPSPVTIMPEKAPNWARPPRRPTEYDLIMEGVQKCGLVHVDLRPVLTRARADGGEVYRRFDSHWTPLGALLAFNEVVGALGHADWGIRPDSATWTPEPMNEGDLLRLAGLPPQVETIDVPESILLPPEARTTNLDPKEQSKLPPVLVEMGRPGPTVLILGDSYTGHLFPRFLGARTGRVIWIPNANCNFDRSLVARFKVDYALIMPNERYAFCNGLAAIAGN